jgi:hypothetical protein
MRARASRRRPAGHSAAAGKDWKGVGRLSGRVSRQLCRRKRYITSMRCDDLPPNVLSMDICKDTGYHHPKQKRASRQSPKTPSHFKEPPLATLSPKGTRCKISCFSVCYGDDLSLRVKHAVCIGRITSDHVRGRHGLVSSRFPTPR